MPITIRGIRIKTLNVTPKPDMDEETVTGTYQLISSADKVLAEQTLGGYNGMKLTPSPATKKALDALLAAYKADIETMLGLEVQT